MTTFQESRAFLLKHRTDYDKAVADFRWPDAVPFNWALDWFDAELARDPQSRDRPALWIVDAASHRETRLSFAALSYRSNQVANFLRAQGLKRGDHLLLLLGNVVPPASIDGLAFAFKDTKQAFAAMDGELGDYVRSEIETRGMHALPNPFDNGFRHITANKPVRNVADVDGLKIRVPVAPLFVDTWKTLGAAPTPINVSELYTALKTRIVDAEENALININQSKLFEVQKTLNFSYHAWACWWMLVNKDAWDALGPQIQAIVTRNQKKYAALQRRDFQLLTDSLTDKLHRYGMEIYQCDIASFKAKLGPYYAKWKGQFGSKAWETLEKYTGKLA